MTAPTPTLPHWRSVPEDAPERIVAVELTRHDPAHTPGLGWVLKWPAACAVVSALKAAGYRIEKEAAHG